MTKTEQLLRELIALPSVNPAFLPGQEARTGERRVADFLAAAARRAGLDVKFQPVFPGRSNLLARLSPRGKARQRILLAPHLDTVNAAAEQFVPRTRNGRLYGRGTCDTKGSVATMFAAVCEVARSGQRPAETEIIFAGLVDEENGQTGSRALAASGLKADLAIVGEPTGCRVVSAHKGNLWLRLETRGKSAHGARPELGRNAVHAMARVVDLLETEYAARLRQRRHVLLGRPTVNVGVISGGTQANIVPDSCAILVDRRTLPGETEQTVRTEIKVLLRKHHLQATLGNDKLGPCLPLETDPKTPLVAQLMRSVGQRRPAGVDYFCDASVLAHGGIPSVVFGPGDIAQAHTADEWVSLADLERAQALLTRFLRSLP
jgi:acetylornithine deacetylase/succinyl-diaminopimelate desuccinylase family protein